MKFRYPFLQSVIALCFLFIFNIQLQAQSCLGTDTITTLSGVINDGSNSSNYSNNLNCGWLIQPKSNPARITFTMDTLNLTGFSDRVRAYDGVNATGNLLGTYSIFSGNNLTVVALSGSMFLQFTTNNSGTAQGWSGTFTSTTDYCDSSRTFTSNFGANFTDGSPDGTNYNNNTDCQWLIQPTNQTRAVNLSFSRFDTQANSDTVTLYDGATTSDPIIGTFSGSTTPSSVYVSSGPNMLVTFKSNGTTTGNGWRATYQTQDVPLCSGQTTLTSPTGTFNDGSTQNGNYVSNSNCSWLINPPGAVSIDLNFNYFNTQAQNDIVRIYNGTDNTAPQLGVFSGNTLPPTITAVSGAMYVEFTTSFNNNSTGWEASYTSTNTLILDANPDTVYVNAGAGSTSSFTLNSNLAWSVSDNASWLIASPATGFGNGTINLFAIQGNIGPDRDARVIINANNGSVSDTVVVIQDASGRFISADPDTLYFDATAAPSQSLTLNTNVNWTLNSNASWVSFTPSSGSNNGAPNVSVQNNTSILERTSFIVISGNLGASNDTVFVVQEPFVPTLSISPSTITLAQAMGSTDSFTVFSNESWQTQSGSSWLTVTNPSLTSDTNSVQITANSMNLSATDRNSYVAIQNTNGTLFDTLFVTQMGGILVVTPTPRNITLARNSGTNASVNLDANVSWAANSSASWLSVNPTSGNDTTTLTVSANSTNSMVNNRNAHIALSGANGAILDTIFVDQLGTNSSLSLSTNMITLAATGGSLDSFIVNSNTAWLVNSGAGWLGANLPANPSGTLKVDVVANSTNMSGFARSSFIAVQDTAGSVFDTVFVTQQSTLGSINVDRSNVILSFSSGSKDSVIVSSDVNWTVNNPASWLSVTPLSGTNNGQILLTANSINQTGNNRVTTLSVDGAGAISKTITVTQIDANNPPAFESSRDTVYIDSSQNSSTIFSIISNVNSWTLTENSSWLLINPTTGSGTAVVSALANSKNPFGSPRYTDIIASTSGFTDRVIVVAQRGSTPKFDISKNSIVLGSDSLSSSDFDINSNLILWNVSENENWLRVTPTSGGFIETVSVIATRSNKTGTQRTTSVIVSSPPLTPQTITVTQDTVRTIGIEENIFKSSLQLYPNPSSGQINLKIGERFVGYGIEGKVYNSVGAEIPVEIDFSTKNNAILDFSQQANGIYFIQLNYNGVIYNKKFSIVR